MSRLRSLETVAGVSPDQHVDLGLKAILASFSKVALH